MLSVPKPRKSKIPKIQALIKEGNKYLLYFAGVFLFILLAIVIPLKHPGDKSVNDAITSVNTQITFLNSTTAHLLRQKDSIYQEEQLKAIDDKLQEAESKRTALLKERIGLFQMADKSVNLPILNIAISQSIVLATFMGFILIGLSVALHYRDRFFSFFYSMGDDERKLVAIPFWCAPIPLTTKHLGYGQWIFKNVCGILVQAVIIYLGIDSIAASRKIDAEISAVNVIIYSGAIAIYVITICQLIKQEWKRTLQ